VRGPVEIEKGENEGQNKKTELEKIPEIMGRRGYNINPYRSPSPFFSCFICDRNTI